MLLQVPPILAYANHGVSFFFFFQYALTMEWNISLGTESKLDAIGGKVHGCATYSGLGRGGGGGGW